ncbi:hypothetical protein Agub_g12387 [Astrephomene gubernaculifera]|uniref:Uncharacterized protein n=1 Tax=Astrephomene gubernaculifera TaxID=47775 RepID=A0AAD3HRR5_9CHLO|nr:hypothetical protein Agub_g12387 [Astrephomene gubernaculifera]
MSIMWRQASPSVPRQVSDHAWRRLSKRVEGATKGLLNATIHGEGSKQSASVLLWTFLCTTCTDGSLSFFLLWLPNPITGFTASICERCNANTAKHKGLSAANLSSGSRKRLAPEDADDGGISPDAYGFMALRRSVTTALEGDGTSPALVGRRGASSDGSHARAFQRSQSTGVLTTWDSEAPGKVPGPVAYGKGTVEGASLVLSQYRCDDGKHQQRAQQLWEQQEDLQPQQDDDGGLLAVPVIQPEPDSDAELEDQLLNSNAERIAANAESFIAPARRDGGAAAAAAVTAVAALSQKVWDQPYDDFLSGQRFTFGAVEDGFFETDVISLGSASEESDGGSGAEEDDTGDDAVGGESGPESPLHGGSAAGSGRGDRGATHGISVEAPPQVFTQRATPSTGVTEPGTAVMVSVAGSSGACTAVVAAVEAAAPLPAPIDAVHGPPGLGQFPDPLPSPQVPTAMDRVDDERGDIQHVAREHDEAALLPPRSYSADESVGSGGVGDGRAGGLASGGGSNCASAAMSRISHAAFNGAAYPGEGAEAMHLAGSLGAAGAAVTAFMAAAAAAEAAAIAATAAAAASAAFAAAPVFPQERLHLGNVNPLVLPQTAAAVPLWLPQTAAVAPLLLPQTAVVPPPSVMPAEPSPPTLHPRAFLPSLLPPETYLGFVNQLVASVRTAARVAAEACGQRQQCYPAAAHEHVVPTFGGCMGGMDGEGGGRVTGL